MISLLPSKEYRLKHLLFAGGKSGVVLCARGLIYFLFSRQRALDQYSSVDASAMIFILYAVVAFYIAYKDLQKDRHKIGKQILLNSPLNIFFIYTIYGMVSMFWSVNLPMSGFRAFECLSMMMLIAATIQNLFRNASHVIVLQWSMMYVTLQASFSVISTLSWTSNLFVVLGSSQMDATCFFFMAFYATVKNWRHYLIIAMSILSMSTVAYIGMALGLVSMYKVKVTKGMKNIILLGSLALLGIMLYMGPEKFIKDTLFFDKEEISLEHTSGRNHIMEVVLNTTPEYPFGNGFFAGEPYILYRHFAGAINGHNSFFSAAMGVGIPGVILLAAFFFVVGIRVFNKKIPPAVRGPLVGCFFVAFLHCMGNPSIGSRVYGAWMSSTYIFTLICAYSHFGDIENWKHKIKGRNL